MPEKILESDVCFTQHLLSSVVTLGQWLFLLPVYGYGGQHYTSIQVKWWSLKMIVSILFAIYNGLICIAYTYKVIYNEKKILALFALIYHLSVGLTIVCFIDVATKWRNLMKEWSIIDFKMSHFEKNLKIKRRITMVIVVFMALGIGEHIFFMLSVSYIQKMFTDNFWTQLDAYFINFYSAIFKIIPYNRFIGILIQIMNWQLTLVWNYADIYLIAMCIPLNFRMKQIEHKLSLMIKYKIQDPLHWKQLRETFILISNICVRIEKCTGHILVLTMGLKLMVILFQILGAINGVNENLNDRKLEDRLYFIFSVGVMIFKQVVLTIYFSSVDLTCQNIVGYLFNVPSHIYNIEVERFIVCIKQSSPVLSGLKLYTVRRSLILKMASVVVVYELVLVTFTKN
ncbi:gustatory receptor for sugar taste 64f-like [Anthonomus grandis grandis]|uniref:gustatory receptor for sugar taste 64f-like n=1 Tax=Anthonomus grandis grandis TaxID=2921223 RepID=UPI002165F60B|nr:gustatory receptor for sugar taste 64f-like [Anthonomus grandis grandis]